MAVVQRRDNTGEVVEKVLRRVEVAKVARSLQDRLAFATFKAQHGWQNLTIGAIEAEVGEQLKRKRTDSISGNSTSSGSDIIYDRRNLDSSPLTAPIFSDDIQGPGGTYKRPAHKISVIRSSPPPTAHKRIQSNPAVTRKSTRPARRTWKSSHNLADSSPVQDIQMPLPNHTRSFGTANRREVSVRSPPNFDSPSDEELDPIHSFQFLSSSPPRLSPTRASQPRTPPPNRSRSARTQKTGRPGAGEEGADLLLYLASSPSPAHRTQTPAHGQVSLPSTPPSQPALPSSMMNTPGGGNLFGLSTPGQNFNFADFVNVTPSPAQAPWGGRTPGPAKTPLAAKEARRRLNFDNLVPPTNGNVNGSPKMKASGLALQLGEELGPRD